MHFDLFPPRNSTPFFPFAHDRKPKVAIQQSLGFNSTYYASILSVIYTRGERLHRSGSSVVHRYFDYYKLCCKTAKRERKRTFLAVVLLVVAIVRIDVPSKSLAWSAWNGMRKKEAGGSVNKSRSSSHCHRRAQRNCTRTCDTLLRDCIILASGPSTSSLALSIRPLLVSLSLFLYYIITQLHNIYTTDIYIYITYS